METGKVCSESGKLRCHVNTKLLPIKAFYFTFLAGVGSLFPFVSIYMKQLGLTSTETGIIYGTMPFVCFFVRPMVGAIADRWLKHKAVLIVCTLLTALLHLLIMLVPSRPLHPYVIVGPVVLTCGPSGSLLTSCGEEGVKGQRVEVLRMEVEGVASSSDCLISLPQYAELVSGVGESTRHNPNDIDVLSLNNDDDNSNRSSSNSDNNKRNNNSINISNGNSNTNVSNRTASSSAVGGGGLSNTKSDAKANNSNIMCRLSCRDKEFDTSGDSESCSVCFSDSNIPRHPCNGTLVDYLHHRLQLQILNARELLSRNVKRANNASEGENHTCNQYSVGNLQHEDVHYNTMTCDIQRTLTCEMACENKEELGLCASGSVSVDITFGLMFLLFFFASAAFSPVFSLADAAIFDLLGEQQHKYGQQRMWGTLGLAIFAITCTFVMNVMRDVNRTINYDVMFYFFAGLCTLSALLASFMTISTAARCQSIVKNACRLSVVPEVLVFLLVVMYLGMVSGTVEGFLFWYLTDLGAGPLVFGFCLVVNCAFEIPFFFFSGAIIERLGRMVCLYSAMFVLSVRLLAYSLLSNPWHVLFVETLHGVTFAVMWAAVTTHANSIAPAGMSASTQGLVGGMNFGIGKGLGSLLTGLLFDRVGARWTFRVYAVACLLLLVAYASFNSLIASSRGQKDKHHEVIIQEHGTGDDGGNAQRRPFLQNENSGKALREMCTSGDHSDELC